MSRHAPPLKALDAVNATQLQYHQNEVLILHHPRHCLVRYTAPSKGRHGMDREP